MTSITCKEAAEQIISKNDYDGLSAINFDDMAPLPIKYMSDEVAHAVAEYVGTLDAEEKFWVWYTADDSVDWMHAISPIGAVSPSKDETLNGFAIFSVYQTVKLMLVANDTV